MTKEEEIKIPRIIVHDMNELVGYFKSDNIEVFKDVFFGIQQGFQKELEEIDIFEVELAETRNVLVFTLKKEDWIRELKLLLDSFIRLEEYEYAGNTKELIKEIENKKVSN